MPCLKYGCGHAWDVPCHIQRLYRGKEQSAVFVKACQNLFMQQQNNEPSRTQNGGHTHTFKVSYFHMPYLPSMSALGPPGTKASCIKFWVKLPHQRGIYSHRERVRDRYSEFSCQNTSTPPPVIQFCCCFLRVTNRTQGLLELFSFSSLPSPWKLLTTFSLVLPLIPSGHAHHCVCALNSS